MHRVLIRLLLFIMLIPGGIEFPLKLNHNAKPEIWSPVSPGIAYREFHLSHPNRVFVARMDRSAESVILDTGIGMGNFTSGLQTVREMANLYDQSIGYWGREWGTLNEVVVAINGYFYDTQTGFPWSGQVISSWYARQFDERQSGSSFVWTFDRNLFIGECVVHPAARQVIRFHDRDALLNFDSINSPGKDNSLVIYTAHYGASTPPEPDKVEVVVRLEQPLMIMPGPAELKGEIIDIRTEQSPIGFDQIILSARGNKREKLLQSARIGDEVGISQELKHYLSDCKTPNPINWENVYAATGASFVFLRESKVQPLREDLGAVLRSPRTAIAYNDRYIFFLVVDGRDRFRSLGMSMVELGVFTKMTLGADWGVAMDGGGSSTMVVNGRVVNHPMTDIEEENSNSVQEVERAVANSWMMVSVKQGERSSRFQVFDPVFISAEQGMLLRAGPGVNYPQFAVFNYQEGGTILDHRLNGVYAHNTFWWYARFGQIEGWIAETGIITR